MTVATKQYNTAISKDNTKRRPGGRAGLEGRLSK